MALKKCKECGREISTKAESCPNCGAPIKGKKHGCGGFIISVVVVIAILVSISNSLEQCQNHTAEKKQSHKTENRYRTMQQQISQFQSQRDKSVKPIIAEFQANKAEFTDELESLIERKEYSLAQEELKKFDIPELSQELSIIKRKVKEGQLYEKVKKIPSKNYRENYNIYRDLVWLNPEKELYRKKRDYYKAKLDEEEKPKVSRIAIAGRQYIGRWVDDDPYAGSILEIYKQDGKFYMYQEFKDGSASTDEIIRISKSTGKVTFQKINPVHGDHYVINRNNQLEMRDSLGLIQAANPIN